MLQTLEDLRFSAWRTSSNRFDATRRLKRREILSTLSLSLFSVLTIGVAVVQRVFGIVPGSPTDNYLTVIAVVSGMCILVVSLIEWGNANAVGGEALHRNAEELNNFQRRVKLLIDQAACGSVGTADCILLEAEYARIKGSCPFNHAPIDDLQFLALHRNEPEFLDKITKEPRISWMRAQYIFLQWWASGLGYVSLIWLVAGALTYTAFHFATRSPGLVH
jgi:SMODS and SLOG-associating 2TM effector domain family 5